MDSPELRRRRDKYISRYDVLNFRMGYSNAATGRELKDCMTSFFQTLPPGFFEEPTEEDEKRFNIDGAWKKEPFDSVSEAILENIIKFRKEYNYNPGGLNEDFDVVGTPLKKTKRKRLDEFTAKPQMIFAKNATICQYENLLKPFIEMGKRRNQHRVVKCKRDVNLITPLMRKWKLEKLREQVGIKQIAESTLVYHIALFKLLTPWTVSQRIRKFLSSVTSHWRR